MTTLTMPLGDAEQAYYWRYAYWQVFTSFAASRQSELSLMFLAWAERWIRATPRVRKGLEVADNVVIFAQVDAR